MDKLKNFTIKCIEKIKNASEQNKLIIFVGAGVSVNSGLPTWNDLIKKMADELKINFDSKNTDEYLKIPQYYYNEYGKQRYSQVINDTFHCSAEPNEIHRLIFDLNPQHIITTNYDNLVEKTIEQICYRRIYSKITKDSDFSNASSTNYIIKMHGEIENIVLKESDYDSYENNYRLIETYIKGLFATHTILFVGFSAEDPNIQKIMQWVQNILKGKQKPAYLLDVSSFNMSKDEFQIKTNYYKKRGIYKLHYSLIKEQMTVNKSNDVALKGRGLELYNFLRYIRDFNDYGIDKYYNTLKQIECLNVITKDILDKIFETDIFTRLKSGALYGENKQKSYQLDNLRVKKFISDNNITINNIKYLYNNSMLLPNERGIVSKIYESTLSSKNLTLKQSKQIKQIIAALKRRYHFQKNEKEKINYIFEKLEFAQKTEQQLLNTKMQNKLLLYDYDGIDKIALTENTNNTVNVFQKAYLDYKNMDYINSFYELEKISKNYNTNPVVYYIAEYNKKWLSRIINNYSTTKRTDEQERIINEFKKIDLDWIKNNKISQNLKNIIDCFSMDNLSKKNVRNKSNSRENIK